MENNQGSGNTNTPAETKGQEVAQNQNTLNHQDSNRLEFGEEIRKLLATAGTLDLTEAQKQILEEPIKDEDVWIKQDGLIYLSWIKYAERLNKAFTGLGWAMIPQGMPKMFNGFIVWGFHLVIKGSYCGFAFGEQEYQPNNNRMSYGDACEGAKSNALMRLCKPIGIGNVLWDKKFKDRWLEAYAKKEWNEEKKKWFWSIKPGVFDNKDAAAPEAKTVVTPPPSEKKEPIKEEKKDEKTPPASVKTAATTTPKEEKKDEKTPTPPASGKPAATIISTGGKKGKKLPENTEFLSQESVPLEPLSEEEANQKTGTGVDDSRFQELKLLVEKSDTTGKLKMNYETAKKAQAAGEINEDQKEVIRKIANQLFVHLATQGK